MITINPAEMERRQIYKLMTGSIIPRPIAWVSSVAADGTPNLAPFSYFTAVSADPPTVLFCAGKRSVDSSDKDTFNNVEATKEFVINFVDMANAEAMNITATEVAPDVSEFERTGLTPLKSDKISAPRVAESPIQWECTLHQIVDVGYAHIVIGEVVAMHFREDVHQDNHYINVEAYDPLARLAGSNYATLGELFQLKRPPSEIEKK